MYITNEVVRRINSRVSVRREKTSLLDASSPPIVTNSQDRGKIREEEGMSHVYSVAFSFFVNFTTTIAAPFT